MGLKKFIMTCIHHCNITLSTFTSLQILCSTHSSFSSPAPSNQSSFHCLHNFVFSRMSRSWNPALNCSLRFVAWRDHQNYNNSMRKVFFSPFHIPDTESQVIAGDHRAGESDSRSSDPFPQGLQVWRGEGSDDGDSLLSCLQGFSHVNLSYFKGKRYFKYAVFLLHLFQPESWFSICSESPFEILLSLLKSR